MTCSPLRILPRQKIHNEGIVCRQTRQHNSTIRATAHKQRSLDSRRLAPSSQAKSPLTEPMPDKSHIAQYTHPRQSEWTCAHAEAQEP